MYRSKHIESSDPTDDPHPCARSEKQLKDNLGAIDWTLTEEQYKRLDEVSAIDLGFPHGLIKGNDLIFGATFD